MCLSFFSVAVLVPSSPAYLMFTQVMSLLSAVRFSVCMLSPECASFGVVRFLVARLFPAGAFLGVARFSVIPLVVLPLPAELFFAVTPKLCFTNN